MSQSFDVKEQLVEDFIKTISYIDDKPFYEIENEIQAIVYKIITLGSQVIFNLPPTDIPVIWFYIVGRFFNLSLS